MALKTLLATRARRFFIITIVIQALLVIVMAITTFGLVHTTYLGVLDGPDKTIYYHLSYFIMTETFELLVAYDALRTRSVFQLNFIVHIFHGLNIVLSAIEVYEMKVALVQTCHLSQCINDSEWHWQKVQGFLIVVPCIIAASWIPLIFSVKQLHKEFGRAMFYVVGESSQLNSMYMNYQIFICLLKVDFFWFVGVTLQLLVLDLPVKSIEFGITIAAIPVFLVSTAVCAYAVRNEIKWVMSIAVALMLSCMTYFYKLVCFDLSTSSIGYTVYMASMSSLGLLGTFGFGLKCLQDFDKGLLDSKTHGIDEYHQLSSSSNVMEGIQNDPAPLRQQA